MPAQGGLAQRTTCLRIPCPSGLHFAQQRRQKTMPVPTVASRPARPTLTMDQQRSWRFLLIRRQQSCSSRPSTPSSDTVPTTSTGMSQRTNLVARSCPLKRSRPTISSSRPTFPTSCSSYSATSETSSVNASGQMPTVISCPAT